MTSTGRLARMLLMAVGAAAATAASAAQPRRTAYVGSAAQVMAIAEEAVRRGDPATAENVFKAMLADPAPEVRAEVRFRLAKLFAAAGRTSEAAVLLRRILDDHPGAAPARLELAALLSKMGHEDSALRQLRALRTVDLPPNLTRFVDRWSASLQASKPFGAQVELALAPDSNINRATRSDTLGTIFGDFTLEDAKARSGVGIALRGAAQARFSLGRDLRLVARAVTDSSLYREKDFNDINVDLSLGPEFRIGRSRLSLDAGMGQQWYGMEPYQRGFRLSGSITRPVDAVSQLRLDAAIRWTDNKLNDLQDGRGLSLRARYERALSQRFSLIASLSADRFRARDGAYSTRSWNAGLTAVREIGRMTLSAGAEVGRLKADERLAILPEARDDRLTRFSFGAVLRQFTVAGFAPMTKIVRERNRSTVEFYDFERTRTEIGISRAF